MKETQHHPTAPLPVGLFEQMQLHRRSTTGPVVLVYSIDFIRSRLGVDELPQCRGGYLDVDTVTSAYDWLEGAATFRPEGVLCNVQPRSTNNRLVPRLHQNRTNENVFARELIKTL